METLAIPTRGLAKYIGDLAHQHNVRYVRTADDVLVDVITRLADDDVVTDDTEDLIQLWNLDAQSIQSQRLTATPGAYP